MAKGYNIEYMGKSVSGSSEEEDLRDFLRTCKPLEIPEGGETNNIALWFHVKDWPLIKRELLPITKKPFIIRVDPRATYGDYLAE